MTDILSKINSSEILFNDCIFERRYIDKTVDEALGAIYNGNADITTVTGQKFNTSLLLDGNGDYIDYGKNEVANFGLKDLSLEIVFKRSATQGAVQYLAGNNDGTAEGWHLRFRATNTLVAQIDDGTDQYAADTATITNQDWHHVIATFDRDSAGYIYLDGGNVVEGIGSITDVDSISTTHNLCIGGDGLFRNNFPGEIAMFRLWKRALTSSEVSQLAAMEGFGSGNSLLGYRTQGIIGYWPLGNIQNTTVNDIKGSNNGTATSMTEANLVNGYNYNRFSLDFDGSADKVTLGDLSSLSIQAISFWVKPDSTSESFLQLKSSTQRSIEVAAGTIGTTGLTSATVYNNGKASTTLQSNVWNNIVVTFSAVTDADNVILGAEGANWYDGKMSDVLLWSRQPTPLEIELIYKNQLKGLKI